MKNTVLVRMRDFDISEEQIRTSIEPARETLLLREAGKNTQQVGITVAKEAKTKEEFETTFQMGNLKKIDSKSGSLE